MTSGPRRRPEGLVAERSSSARLGPSLWTKILVEGEVRSGKPDVPTFAGRPGTPCFFPRCSRCRRAGQDGPTFGSLLPGLLLRDLFAEQWGSRRYRRRPRVSPLTGPYRLTVPPRRTKHLRFNEPEDPDPIPEDTDYASVIESDVPVVVQHTRLDSRQAKNALPSTIACASDS